MPERHCSIMGSRSSCRPAWSATGSPRRTAGPCGLPAGRSRFARLRITDVGGRRAEARSMNDARQRAARRWFAALAGLTFSADGQSRPTTRGQTRRGSVARSVALRVASLDLPTHQNCSCDPAVLIELPQRRGLWWVDVRSPSKQDTASYNVFALTGSAQWPRRRAR